MDGFWPNFSENDERIYHLQKAYIAATSGVEMDVEHATREERHPEWRPAPLSTTRPLIRILCSHPEHGPERPMLAEVWRTKEHGPLFLAKLGGAVLDPPDDPTDPFAPPTAVLSGEERAARRRLSPRPGPEKGWLPVPVTIVRIFLADPSTVEAALWVKCPDHGPATVDRLKLNRVYRDEVEKRSRGRDTPEPTVTGLHTVGAVSST